MDIDQRIDTLERRLSAMERKSRAWRILALLLLVALVGGVASEGVFDNASWAADEKAAKEKVTKFDVVEANVIRIRDPDGNIRCQLRSGTLLLGSVDGKAMISVSAQKTGVKSLPYSARIRVSTPSGTSSLTGDSIEVRNGALTKIVAGRVDLVNKTVATELEAIMERFSRGNKFDARRYAELTARTPDVVFSVADGGGGGYIQVSNTFGAPVVQIQNDKTNQGAIFVNNVSGKSVRSLHTH